MRHPYNAATCVSRAALRRPQGCRKPKSAVGRTRGRGRRAIEKSAQHGMARSAHSDANAIKFASLGVNPRWTPGLESIAFHRTRRTNRENRLIYSAAARHTANCGVEPVDVRMEV